MLRNELSYSQRSQERSAQRDMCSVWNPVRPLDVCFPSAGIIGDSWLHLEELP